MADLLERLDGHSGGNAVSGHTYTSALRIELLAPHQLHGMT